MILQEMHSASSNQLATLLHSENLVVSWGSCYTLWKVQKILLYALKSENTFQSFNMEVYEKIFFS